MLKFNDPLFSDCELSDPEHAWIALQVQTRQEYVSRINLYAEKLASEVYDLLCMESYPSYTFDGYVVDSDIAAQLFQDAVYVVLRKFNEREKLSCNSY